MKLKLIIDERKIHARFRVFVNGAFAGRLVMREAEFDDFMLQLEAGGDVDVLKACTEHDWRTDTTGLIDTCIKCGEERA